ncbi:enolase-phosphatase E1 [Malaya genurostris]|uniref:enolase-phosphatase E1 n=1 Tax=Malaya genurostris TaxID=325434 RepID=UPI0026F3A08F|nr:enolase-phosphatase E1 [Malaya genurostris]
MAAVSFDEKVLAAKSIICDIEGTTSSVSFVKDVLYPYVLKNVEEYLKTHWSDDATKTVVAALREQAEEDKKAEVEGAVTIPAEDSEDIIADVVKNVEWQMSLDRKTGALKTLQGLVWAEGYNDGSIKGHVYDDVSKAFEQWTEAGRKIYIYSSGSVDAQKLLFKNSEQGDLVKYLAGHYDTKIGAKQEKDSYEAILKNIEVSAEEALFLTDVIAEAKAAKEAGLNVVVLDRPGNAELSDDDRSAFTVISSFTDIPIESAEETTNGAGKRKIDETAQDDEAQQPPSKLVKVTATAENDTSKVNGKAVEEEGSSEQQMDVDAETTDGGSNEKQSVVATLATEKTESEIKKSPDVEENTEVSKTDKQEEDAKREEPVINEKTEEKTDKVDDKTVETAKPKSNTDAETMDIDEEDGSAKEEAPKQSAIEKEVADTTSNTTVSNNIPKDTTVEEKDSAPIAAESTESVVTDKMEETVQTKADTGASVVTSSNEKPVEKMEADLVDSTEVVPEALEQNKKDNAPVDSTKEEEKPNKLAPKDTQSEEVSVEKEKNKTIDDPMEDEKITKEINSADDKEKPTQPIEETKVVEESARTETSDEEPKQVKEVEKSVESKVVSESVEVKTDETKPETMAVEVVSESKGVESTTAEPVEEVAVEAKEDAMETDSPICATPEVQTANKSEATTEQNEATENKSEEPKSSNPDAATAEEQTSEKEEVSTTTATVENGTHQNGVAKLVNGKDVARVPENGEANTTESTTNGTNGNHDEKSDSDKENDTSSTNVEETDATVTNSNENGTTNSSNPNTTSATTTTSSSDLVTEIKSKKVIDVGASTPTPPIEAES